MYSTMGQPSGMPMASTGMQQQPMQQGYAGTAMPGLQQSAPMGQPSYGGMATPGLQQPAMPAYQGAPTGGLQPPSPMLPQMGMATPGVQRPMPPGMPQPGGGAWGNPMAGGRQQMPQQLQQGIRNWQQPGGPTGLLR